MANILSKTGIVDNSTVRTWHVTQSIDAFTGTQAYDVTLSGSLTVVGSLLPNSAVTGTLITSASYADRSLYASTILSASDSTYANLAPDTTIIQLHHGIVELPDQDTKYFFAMNPITGSTDGTLPTTTDIAGTVTPSQLYVLSASLSTTVNGTLATGEQSTYTLVIGGDSFILNPFNHSSNFTSSITNIGGNLMESDEITYVTWQTPSSWSTAPTKVSHNLVLYCTRYSNPV
jgi:hypothetical protein